jgi:uncharacterized membrane protein YhaH (DUF805 family)
MFSMGGVGMFGLLGGFIGGIIGLALFVFWLWMLIHALTNKGLDGMGKILWVIVIIFLPFVGSLIYFFIGRPKGGG